MKSLQRRSQKAAALTAIEAARGNTMSREYKLKPEQITAIEKAAKRADRIELIPHENGFRIAVIRRESLKTEQTFI